MYAVYSRNGYAPFAVHFSLLPAYQLFKNYFDNSQKSNLFHKNFSLDDRLRSKL